MDDDVKMIIGDAGDKPDDSSIRQRVRVLRLINRTVADHLNTMSSLVLAIHELTGRLEDELKQQEEKELVN